MSRGEVGSYCVPQHDRVVGGRSSYSGIASIQYSYLRQAVTLQTGSTTRRSSKSYTVRQSAAEKDLLGKASVALQST